MATESGPELQSQIEELLALIEVRNTPKQRVAEVAVVPMEVDGHERTGLEDVESASDAEEDGEGESDEGTANLAQRG